MNGSPKRVLRPLATGLAVLATVALAVAAAEPPRFVERSRELGLDFVHRHFGTGEKYMPENMAPGVALFDFDGDGLLDVFFPQGAPLAPGAKLDPPAGDRLFRQTPAGTFEDVSASALPDERGYGMGATFADVDGDGDLDLYVTNFGPNALLVNRGDGTFASAPVAAGASCPLWSVGAGFFDAEGDGDADLFVVNYVDFAFDKHKWCGNAQSGVRSYCHPDVYDGLPDCFFLNGGDGTFADAADAAGILATAADKGLGVGFADFDGNGTTDVYVANDSTMNYLYLGDGEGGFREEALLAGVGFSGSGAAEASMGVEIGDLDGDGGLELFLTHLDEETNTLYRPLAPGLFTDATAAAGLAAPSLPWVGFGNVFLDHDHDGDLDIFVANGHIIDNIELFDASRSHRQPAQLFDNLGNGRFREVSDRLGPIEPLVGRGAAAGDLDGDGDLDLVVAQNGGPARVLVNEGGSARPWLAFRLVDAGGRPHAFGARLELTGEESEPSRQVRWAPSASGYLSQGEPAVHFGLGGSSAPRDLEIEWPSGRRARYLSLPAGARYSLFERAAEDEPGDTGAAPR